ncbi:MAG: hypothetical protein PHQ36_09525 [Anaerolineales bacterium]|nr:hypothetical protein [Anaerolineales bacterium]
MSKFLDRLSEFLAHRKGLLPLVGIALILLNLILQFVIPENIVAASNLFFHIGVIVAIFGLMLAWAL